MGMVKDSLFDVLEVALASLECIWRAWEEGDREMLERVFKGVGKLGRPSLVNTETKRGFRERNLLEI